jgi:hypothetical protein
MQWFYKDIFYLTQVELTYMYKCSFHIKKNNSNDAYSTIILTPDPNPMNFTIELLCFGTNMAY